MKKKKTWTRMMLPIIGIILAGIFLISKKSPRAIRPGEYRNSDW